MNSAYSRRDFCCRLMQCAWGWGAWGLLGPAAAVAEEESPPAEVREAKPEIMVLDVMMPKEGGVQLYRDLKSDPVTKDIPVIMLSVIAKKTFFHTQNLLNQYTGRSLLEPEAYIEKPPEPDELLAITEKILRAKRGNLPSV